MLYPLVRIMMILVSGFGASLSRDAPRPSLFEPHSLGVPVMMVLLAWIDLYRRDETVFFANLGLGMGQLAALYVAPAVLIELVLLAIQ